VLNWVVMRLGRFGGLVMLMLLAPLLTGCGSAGLGGQSTAARQSGAAALSASPRASASVEAQLTVPPANRSGTFTTNHTLRLPRGWKAEVWALVPNARLEEWSPQGALLVSDPTDGKITALRPQASRSAPPSQRVIVSGLNQPQGMAFDHVGGREVLYVAETDQIDRYEWLGNHVGSRTVLISGLPSGDDHALKNVVIGHHHDVYVDIGSTSNASPSPASNPPYASVVEYSPSGRRIRVWATGIRNGDGLSVAPDGSLWTAVNERDDITYPFRRAYAGTPDAYGQVIQAYVNNHPPDEIAKLSAGRNLGWPFCDPDPDIDPGAARTGFKYTNLGFVFDQQTNAGGHILNCKRLQPLNVGLPAHSAPLGFHFLERSRLPKRWRSGAVVVVHGSWDRQPPRAPAILWMRWGPRRHTLGSAQTLISGFQYPSGDRWGRTVDAVPGPDGALYVSDDTAGAVYRIDP
jgi:glucose/arabinose dehydrogenase